VQSEIDGLVGCWCWRGMLGGGCGVCHRAGGQAFVTAACLVLRLPILMMSKCTQLWRSMALYGAAWRSVALHWYLVARVPWRCVDLRGAAWRCSTLRGG
jgi:hypothetical protein